MNFINRVLAILLSALLGISNTVPVLVEEDTVSESEASDEAIKVPKEEAVYWVNMAADKEQQESVESDILVNSENSDELLEPESEKEETGFEHEEIKKDDNADEGSESAEGAVDSEGNKQDDEQSGLEKEENDLEKTDSEETGSGKTDSEGSNSEGSNSEGGNSEGSNSEEGNSEGANSEESDSEGANSEEGDLEESDSEETDSEEAETEDLEKGNDKKADSGKIVVTDEVHFNTGKHEWVIVNEEAFDNGIGDGGFEKDGSYTINIPETNPFFPYEVQFTYKDKVSNQWFMTPDDSVKVGGHTFYVSAYFDNTAVTQMNLNVAGDTIIVYPKEKEFTNDGGISAYSLLPLEEKEFEVDLSAYTPAELTMVSVNSIFTGENALKDTDKIIWEYISDGGEYNISSSGDTLDLSYNTYYSSDTEWQMIVGAADQLAADNTRYIVHLKVTDSRDWLLPTFYTQDSDANRTNISVSNSYYYDYDKESRYLYINVPSSKMSSETQAYVSLAINPSVFASTGFSAVKVYEGRYATHAEAVSGTEITNKLFNVDMTQADAGYLLERWTDKWVTMLTYDAGGRVTGCLSFYLYLSYENDGNYMTVYNLYERTGKDINYIVDTSTSTTKDGCKYYTCTLYEGYPANAIYYQEMTYYKAGKDSSFDVTAAYAGNYSSIADAVSKGAQDIKASLFNRDYDNGGYGADYSKGVYFTVFVGEDGSAGQEVYRYNIKTVEGTTYENNHSSGTLVTFEGLKDGNGTDIPFYINDKYQDSYAEGNYVTMFVAGDVDLTNLAPEFWTSSGVKLYAGGSSTPEVSGVSCHNFANGAVQYTASSEDGKNSENYWLQIVKAASGAGNLYINSLDDESSKTEIRDGVIYSIREVILDAYHEYKHDILLANIGTETIDNISVELSSDVIELDKYWTLSGKYGLSGFKGLKDEKTKYGGLANLAMIRLKAKAGTENGADVSGTLTIKSGTTTLMVLTLTGTVGDPCITTKDIPQAVKYVPYGTMIQNNNKYSWNKVSYCLAKGTLPAGMEVRPNGEIYGVPTETGEFPFTVRMKNSYNNFSESSMSYKLVVLENTDTNVDAATDVGYELTQRVQNINMTVSGNSNSSQTLVSQGEYAQFVDVYLDGAKLASGTDYTSEAGSTRITIANQTLVKSNGTHTLGIEFRTQDEENSLNRAAQNYTVNDNKNNGGNSGGSNGGNSGSSGGGSGSSSSGGNSDNSDGGGSSSTGSGGSSTGNGDTNTGIGENGGSRNILVSDTDDAVTTITYTVEAGDSLWKIAKKFYGSGEYWTKIFADNSDMISNPDRIYVGQNIIIYLTSEGTAAAGDGRGSYYTVVRGDTLWKISQKYYGNGRRWNWIYEANSEIIADPKYIYAGQVLFIPEHENQLSKTIPMSTKLVMYVNNIEFFQRRVFLFDGR